MGGAFAATADDITAIYWNPGGLASMYSSEVAFNHVRWLADVNYDFAAFATYLPDLGTIGAFVSVESMDDMLVRTTAQPEGTGELFTAGAMAIGISYARNLTDQFSIGFNAKYVREHLWNMSATGVAIDLGTIYRIPILNEFRLAASISNFGTKMKLEGRDNLKIAQVGGGEGNLINTDIQLDAFDLPLIFRVGVAADVVKDGEHRLTAALDAVHPNDNTEYLNTGVEYAWNEIVFLRGGWKSLFETGHRAALHGRHRSALPDRRGIQVQSGLCLPGLGPTQERPLSYIRIALLICSSWPSARPSPHAKCGQTDGLRRCAMKLFPLSVVPRCSSFPCHSSPSRPTTNS